MPGDCRRHSRVDGRSRRTRRPGERGGPFEDKTEEAGPGDQAAGQDGGFDDFDDFGGDGDFGGNGGATNNGYFEACDWDLDGRTDLIYTAGGGSLLWQNGDGVFEPSHMGEEDGAEIGTAAFGTIGAVDMLVGQLDGTLSLLINETLVDRPERAEISTISDVRKQIRTRIVTVRPVAGKGMVGCRLTLLDQTGQSVTHRWTGTNIGVGCCGPAQFTLAVREPGSYTLRLPRGDGSMAEKELTIDKTTPRPQVLVVK